jgi:ArsR family transcriptional regulator
MKILGEEQVKMSKQLAYMKRLGLLEVDRHAQWRIYRLREPRSPLLVENLKCLQDVAGEDFKFAEDLRERDRILGEEAVSDRPSPCRATA